MRARARASSAAAALVAIAAALYLSICYCRNLIEIIFVTPSLAVYLYYIPPVTQCATIRTVRAALRHRHINYARPATLYLLSSDRRVACVQCQPPESCHLRVAAALFFSLIALLLFRIYIRASSERERERKKETETGLCVIGVARGATPAQTYGGNSAAAAAAVLVLWIGVWWASVVQCCCSYRTSWGAGVCRCLPGMSTGDSGASFAVLLECTYESEVFHCCSPCCTLRLHKSLGREIS